MSAAGAKIFGFLPFTKGILVQNWVPKWLQMADPGCPPPLFRRSGQIGGEKGGTAGMKYPDIRVSHRPPPNEPNEEQARTTEGEHPELPPGTVSPARS